MFRKMRVGFSVEESRRALLLPTQNKKKALLKATCYGIHLPESLQACSPFWEILDTNWLFRSISIVSVTLHNSHLQ